MPWQGGGRHGLRLIRGLAAYELGRCNAKVHQQLIARHHCILCNNRLLGDEGRASNSAEVSRLKTTGAHVLFLCANKLTYWEIGGRHCVKSEGQLKRR